MENQVFSYFLMTVFGISIIKSAIKGATSEFFSLLFTSIAIFGSGLIYKPQMKYMVLSLIIFVLIYTYGLYLGIKNRRTGVVQVLFGIIFGFIKFLLLFVFLLAFLLIFGLASPEFLENQYIKMVLPYAYKVKDFIKTYFFKG